jgi:hypothetical protein
MHNVTCTREDEVDRGGERHGYMAGKPGDCIGSAFALRGPHENAIAAIVVKGRANVPAVLSVGGPRGTLVGLDVNEHSGAWGRNRRAIEVVVAMHLGPGRQLWVEAGATHEVESEDGLWEQAVPQVEREVGVGAAQASNEVVLEGANGAFGRIGAVKTRRDELEVDVLVEEELLESSGALVVEALELGAEASANEPIVDGLVRGEDGGAGLAGHGLGVDGVAVVVIQDEELGVAGAGGEDEAARLVGEDLAGRVRGHARRIAEVGAFTRALRGWEGITGSGGGVGVGGGRVNSEQRQLGGRFRGGAQLLATLVEVAFDGSHRLRWVTAERGRG